MNTDEMQAGPEMEPEALLVVEYRPSDGRGTAAARIENLRDALVSADLFFDGLEFSHRDLGMYTAGVYLETVHRPTPGLMLFRCVGDPPGSLEVVRW